MDIRKEVFRMRGVISSSHARFPAPPLDERMLGELEELVALLGLDQGTSSRLGMAGDGDKLPRR